MSFPFKIPFAASGDQSTVPDSDLTGSVNFTDGYTSDYQADPSLDPNAKLIERDKFNFLMNKTTGAIGEIQRQGVADWYSDLAPYDLNAEVFYNGKRWRSTIANNSATPDTGSEWLDVTPGTSASRDVGTAADQVPLNSMLGTAAASNVTTSATDTTAGRLLKVGDFGLGRPSPIVTDANLQLPGSMLSVASPWNNLPIPDNGSLLSYGQELYRPQFYVPNASPRIYFRQRINAVWASWRELLHTGNTTVDPNGFIKAASPIVSLYRDRAESNGSAELEEVQFERIATGHYRLTGVPELSRDGWYIETPKDRNGNVYFTIDYTESEGQLDIRTYTPDYSSGRATNGEPVDIIDGRFVSLRFAASPETTPPEEA